MRKKRRLKKSVYVVFIGLIVAIIAFLEITIWFLVARTALNTELNLFIVLSYSGGYTMGTILGTIITNNYIKTNMEVILISNNNKITNIIKNNNFGVSILEKQKDKIVKSPNDKIPVCPVPKSGKSPYNQHVYGLF